MDENEKLKKLNVIGKAKVTGSNGKYLCKHPGGMIKRDDSIIAYFMYMPTKEIAVVHYFDFLTKSDTSILLRGAGGFSEFKYDGNDFIKVNKP